MLDPPEGASERLSRTPLLLLLRQAANEVKGNRTQLPSGNDEMALSDQTILLNRNLQIHQNRTNLTKFILRRFRTFITR